MENYINYLLNSAPKCIKKINRLTFIIKSHIFKTNAETSCFETAYTAGWKRSGISYIYSFTIKQVYGGFVNNSSIFCCRSCVKVLSGKKPKREACLKGEMREESTLSITMIVCQIERWGRYTRSWCRVNYFLRLQSNQIRFQLIGVIIMNTKILKRKVV
jgi:hypothetical protein